MQKIKNPTIRAVLMCYWPVVTCIYLCVSFLTFKWHMTWLIWPIAAAVNTIIIAIAKANEENLRNEKSTKNEYED